MLLNQTDPSNVRIFIILTFSKFCKNTNLKNNGHKCCLLKCSLAAAAPSQVHILLVIF